MKHLTRLMLAFMLALAMPAAAFADSLTGGSGWKVTYTEQGDLEDNFAETQFADDMKNLQPGDDITFVVNLEHQNAQSGDWYMSNEVLKSLEEGSAAGSAYGYRLAYVNPAGQETVLYNSDTVGGDNSGGLTDATSGMTDYFYLDTLSSGQAGHVNLVVSLDGETEGNAYFNTLANLKMKFAVDPASPTAATPPADTATSQNNNTTSTTNTQANTRPTTPSREAVKTGDDTNLMPFYIAMAVSGVALVGLGAYSMRLRKGDKGEEASR